MRVLIAGGAGFIGGITAKLFEEAGHEVVVFDNLSTGFRHNVGAEFVEGDLTDAKQVVGAFKTGPFDAVLHFAAKLQVEESVREPKLYFENNVLGSLNLIDAAVKSGSKRFIFSSSATVYGEPAKVPIAETAPIQPINPYGVTKVMVEEMLDSYGQTHGLEWVAFRYFNPVGAYAGIGPSPLVSNLIPAALEALAGKRTLQVFGTDYDTRDGSCIRDYVHVKEIAEAHLLAADQMDAGTSFNRAINLGSGRGYTVLEMLDGLEKAAGKPIPHKIVGRRAGDAPASIASNDLAKKLLGWAPKLGLETMLGDALDWAKANS